MQIFFKNIFESKINNININNLLINNYKFINIIVNVASRVINALHSLWLRVWFNTRSGFFTIVTNYHPSLVIVRSTLLNVHGRDTD